MYNSQKVTNDPVDPNPQQSRSSPTAAPLTRQRSSTESIRSALASSFLDDDAAGGFRSLRRTTSNHYGESKNVFYEQELAKYEQEILELRNMVRLSEMKVGQQKKIK